MEEGQKFDNKLEGEITTVKRDGTEIKEVWENDKKIRSYKI